MTTAGPAAVNGAAVAAVRDAPAFSAAIWSRNAGVISDRDQMALQSMRVLLAGCGTVGASVAEPLARMGVCSFVLADPEVYELSNINRQRCALADIGRPKARVVAERLQAINPFVVVRVLEEGLTAHNVAAAVGSATAVFEGVDAFTSLWIKYLVHAEAARRRIPVLSGVDYGGAPAVYVFDYRRDPRPFRGRATARAHYEGRTLEALRWLGHRAIPADFMPVIEDRLATGRPWPQVAYCADALGALGSRTMLDLAAGRRVRHIVTADLHMLARPSHRRLAGRVAWPFAAARTAARIRLGRPRAALDKAGPIATMRPALRAALEAVRLAPSAHNAQPWRARVHAFDGFRLDWNRARDLPAADPNGRGVCYGLGCALEAAATVVDLSFRPAGGGDDPRRRGWFAGEVTVHDVRHTRYARAMGLLRTRGTTRAPFHADAVERPLLAAARQQALQHGAELAIVAERPRFERLARLTAEATQVALQQGPAFDELLRWIRVRHREWDWDEDGLTAETLQLDPFAAQLFHWLKGSPRLRAIARSVGLPAAVGRQAAASLRACGAVAVVAHPPGSSLECIRAGRALMAAWLALTDAGLAVQPVNWALGAEATRDDVLATCGAPAGHIAVALLRIGRANKPPPASPRLPLERICVMETSRAA